MSCISSLRSLYDLWLNEHNYIRLNSTDTWYRTDFLVTHLLIIKPCWSSLTRDFWGWSSAPYSDTCGIATVGLWVYNSGSYSLVCLDIQYRLSQVNHCIQCSQHVEQSTRARTHTSLWFFIFPSIINTFPQPLMLHLCSNVHTIITMFMLIERSIKKIITILIFVQFSGKGCHTTSRYIMKSPRQGFIQKKFFEWMWQFRAVSPSPPPLTVEMD